MTSPVHGRFGTLTPQSNALSYVAHYARPALELWGNGGAIGRGLLEAYQDFGITLLDISALTGDSLGTQGATVRWSDRSTLTFRFDRIEATIRNYLKSDLDRLPELIRRCEDWLRAAVPDHRFMARVFDSSVHSRLEGRDLAEVFAGLGVRDLQIPAESTSHGASYHFNFPDRDARVDFMLDPSLSVPGGIYMHFGALVSGDVIDYAETFTWSEQTMRSMLASVGLAFKDGVAQ